MSGNVKRQEVVELSRGWGQDVPAPLLDRFCDRIAPSHRLVPRRGGAGSLGVSRIGGQPDLPAGTAWPVFRGFPGKPRAEQWERFVGFPLPFLAQVKLDELPALDGDRILPGSGMLYFFYLDATETFGLYAEHGEVFHVLYVTPTPTTLSRVPFPGELPERLRFDGHAVEPRLEWTLPSPYDLIDEALGVEAVEAHLDLWDHGEELLQRQALGPHYHPRHRVLGNPDLIQTFGLDRGARLLLQVDSDSSLSDYPRTRMSWGDGGRIYFLIDEPDLLAGQLQRAWAYFECS